MTACRLPSGFGAIENFVHRCFGGGGKCNAAGCDGFELNARGSGAVSRLIAKVDGLAGLDGAVGFLIRKD